jgi:hypothetical protein
MSIIRLQIPTSEVPIFTFRSRNTPVDNEGIYSVTLSYDDGATVTNAQVYLTYIPDLIGASTGDVGYFDVYSYQSFVDSTNLAFKQALTDLAAAVSPVVLPVSNSPYITFDRAVARFALIGEAAYDPIVTAPTGTVQVWMNNLLYNYFDGIDAYASNVPTLDPNGKDINIIITNEGNNIEIVTPPNNVVYPNISYTGYIMEQDVPSLNSWSEFKTLVVTSATIPVSQEYIPSSGGDGDNIQRRIISDFVLAEQGNQNLRSTDALYLPSAEYRRLDLIGTIPLRTLDFQFWYQGEDLTLYPLYLPRDSVLTGKLLFEKKNRKQ